MMADPSPASHGADPRAAASTAFASYTPTWTLASVAVPAGRQVEVKLVVTGGNRNVEIAYDTTAYRSTLTLP